MSMTLLRRLGLALAGTGIALALAACGGGGGDGDSGGDASLRLLNLTNDSTAQDLYSERQDTQTVRNEAVARDAIGPYATLNAATYTLVVKRAGTDGTLIEQGSRALKGGEKYTLVTYGYQGAYKSALLAETESDKPESGRTKIRVLNLAPDTVPDLLDVYVTDANVDLADVSPVVNGLEAISTFVTVNSGPRRIRVTAAGNKADLRLDIATVDLASQDIVNVLLAQGNSGVLLHGYVLPQGGNLTVAKNTQSRVRLVSSVTGGGLVGAVVNGTTLATAQRAPSVTSSYVNVAAGSIAGSTFTVNGTTIASPAATLVGGEDYTIMVAGDPGASSVYTFGDDNRMPTTVGKAKFRLYNGAPTEAAGLSLQVNLSPLADGIGFGAASPTAPTDISADATVEVVSAQTGATVYSRTEQTVAERAVYSVFLLTGGTTTTTGLLRKDR